MLETLIVLKNSGTLNHLVQNGVVSPKIFTYLEICMWIDARRNTNGKSLNTLIADAEVAFKVSRSTVWRSLQLLKG